MKQLSITTIILLLLATPLASAEDRIIIPQDGELHTVRYEDQTSANYTFSLRAPLFNLSETPGSPTNDSNLTWKATLKAQILESQDISADNQYKITLFYNDTHSLSVHAYFHRNYYTFGWDKTYDIILDNEKLCSYYATEWGGAIHPPDIALLFDFSLHGRFASAPSTYISVLDNNEGDVTCAASGITALGTEYFSIGGQLTILMQEFTSPPIFRIEVFDEELYAHQISYQFGTKESEEIAREEFNTNSNKCPTSIFGWCLDPVVMAKGAFGFIASLLEIFLGAIPGGQFIFDSLKIVIEPVVDGILFLIEVALGSSPEGIPGAALWMHIVYAFTWGCIMAMFTGNLLYIALFPIMFTWIFLKGMFILFKFLFIDVPMYLWDKAMDAIGKILDFFNG